MLKYLKSQKKRWFKFLKVKIALISYHFIDPIFALSLSCCKFPYTNLKIIELDMSYKIIFCLHTFDILLLILILVLTECLTVLV